MWEQMKLEYVPHFWEKMDRKPENSVLQLGIIPDRYFTVQNTIQLCIKMMVISNTYISVVECKRWPQIIPTIHTHGSLQ